MLISMIILPIIGSFVIASLNENRKGYDLLIRQISLTTSIFV